jgi:hypothetical protein
MAPLFRGLDTGRVDGDADVKRLQARGDRVVNLGSAGHSEWSRAGLTSMSSRQPRCSGVELDPLYVDQIIRRDEAATGTTAILADTGEPFATVAARRRNAKSGCSGI